MISGADQPTFNRQLFEEQTDAGGQYVEIEADDIDPEGARPPSVKVSWRLTVNPVKMSADVR